ncbi:MAG: response regulator [bacterium]|nr:response regulator [bacterium]
MADSLRDLLAAAGYQVMAVYSGQDGIEAVKRTNYHVVVTDLRMRGIDGMDVLRYMHEHFPRSLIIVITGHATTESAIEAVHYQVFDYLRKPFDFDLFRMAIEKAFQKLETDQLREDTAAMFTHDIKIPLTSIIGFASMLYDRERRAFHPRAREFAETNQANDQKILALIENYLTTCRIEAGTLKILRMPVDLPQTIRDVIESSMPEASRRQCAIEAEIDARIGTIDLDEPLIYRAISNLLNNSIKYGSGREAIRLRAYRIDAQASPLRVDTTCIDFLNQVQDAAEVNLSDVFQRYKRAHVRPGVEGSGIGLYVVQAIVQAHEGKVTAEFVSDNTVRFAMFLPCVVEKANVL